jgi:anion-transporting  ArsA/GET3 family ATPase
MKTLLDAKAVVFVGPGGVGKTTSAVVFALLAALAGKRVGLLSIDPSKRLASALGMSLNGQPKRLQLKTEMKGSIHAGVVDLKLIFDDKVREFAKSDKKVERILSHPLYMAASTNLSGPVEYMSLARFQEMIDSGKFDLVILDTPPDHHALDFLTRPNVLAGFMDKKIIQWLVKPFQVAGKLGLGKILGLGERLMGGLAQVTGLSTLHKLADFIVEIQEVIEGFHRLGNRTLEILRENSTRYVLVSSVHHARFYSVEQLGEKLAALGFRSPDLLINRCLPEKVSDELALLKFPTHPMIEELAKRPEREQKLCQWFKTISAGHIMRAEDIGTQVDSLDALLKVAMAQDIHDSK